MKRALVKNSGGKIVPHSDLRAGTARDFASRPKNKNTRIGTWNVRSLLSCGKMANLKIEMTKMKIDILGIAEMRWPNNGDFWSGEHRVIHTGTIVDQPGVGGVGVVLNKEIGCRVKGYVQYNGRIIKVKLDTKPTDTVIIQVYMPTSKHSEEIIEEVYDELNDAISTVKSEENLIIMGDWNAVVGENMEGNIVGNYGYGVRNERGDRLVEFCSRNRLVVANTWYQHHPRRRYTWTAPGDRKRYQIDYILIKQRFRNQVRNCRSYPGPDIDSDHNVVIGDCKLKFKTLKKKSFKGWNLSKLKEEKTALAYRDKTEELVTEVNEGESTDVSWKKWKVCINEAAEKVVGKCKRETKKDWMTEEILDKLEIRRKLKNNKTEEGLKQYRATRNEINRMVKTARDNFLEERCKEVETLMESGKTETAYKIIKTFFGNKKASCNGLKDDDGSWIYEDEEVAKKWRDYLGMLYAGFDGQEGDILEEIDDIDVEEVGDPITRHEFDSALNKLKDKKAPGIDGIPAELIKAAGKKAKDELFKLVDRIYRTGDVPGDFKQCIIIPLPKKASANKCEQYRTLSLISHASKILTFIILKRIEGKVEAMLTDDQFGFRKDRGTREAILALRNITEKRLRKDKDTYIAFVDMEKAFDKVVWKRLFHVIRTAGVKYKDRRTVWKLYQEETAVVKKGIHVKEACIRQGVRQGCSLSPVLFNAYIQAGLDEMSEQLRDRGGVKINGLKINMIRFADDIAILAESKEELTVMLELMDKTLNANYNMKINTGKTKILVISKHGTRVEIKMNGKKLENVKEFRYLGSLITCDGRCRNEINSRIAQAKAAFNSKKGLLTSNAVKLSTRKHLLRMFVWSVLLYGSESWTIGEVDRRKLEAFEMWCYRRMLKIRWVDKVTNEEVLRRTNETPYLWKFIKKRRDVWIGHIYRHPSMIHTILEGMVEGVNCRGRPRLGFIQQIMKDTGCRTYLQMKQLTQDRKRWRDAANQSKDCN